MSDITVAQALTTAFLTGEPDLDQIVDRWSVTLGRRWRWLRPLAVRLLANLDEADQRREVAVAWFLFLDRGFQRACDSHDLDVAQWIHITRPPMRPIAAARDWQVPSICTPGELADWLDVEPNRLEWYADLRSLESYWPQNKLRHYHYRLLEKRFGQVRVIESPKPRLKQIQRQILTGILDHIPPHPAAHGFRRGCSISSFARPHVGKRIVVRIDLQDFFPSISHLRIRALFLSLGYPQQVAKRLAGLCTNVVPLDTWLGDCGNRSTFGPSGVQRLYSTPHLPQGAPTSPALANLCAFRLDCRLAALANSAGATYTRYADDLAFSGERDFERVAHRFHLHVCAAVMEEGFRVHHHKTRRMRRGVRQHLAGLVVNERLNVCRQDFDRLKAILTNCIRHGPQSQNRMAHPDFRGHLAGRIGFFESVNAAKARRLRALFDQIAW
ncbi:MAG: RNA-directed DNA polymerase [Planctomycetales bacterium]|nr:RNA-directed DNA polymerase [Planctomycetales bacterium]